MVDDWELEEFTENWWKGFVTYQEEEGRAYARHIFQEISKEHFVDFLRDAMAEFTQQEQ